MHLAEWDAGSQSRSSFAAAVAEWGDPLAYEQNWTYLRQALRNGGWVIESPIGWLAVSKNYAGPARHVAVVPLTRHWARFLTAALSLCRRENCLPVMLKHVPPAHCPELCETGLMSIAETAAIPGGRLRFEELSEDRLPQILVNVSNGSWTRETGPYANVLGDLPYGVGLQTFRYHLRRFTRDRLVRSERVDTLSIASVNQSDAETAIESWMDSVRLRFSSRPDGDGADLDGCYRQPVVSLMDLAREAASEIVGDLILVGGRPRGAWLGSRISAQCLGVYVLFADTRIRGLSDYALYLALRKARQCGSSFANLGGSELESLFFFKSRPAVRRSNAGHALREVHDLAIRGSVVLPAR
jgi:hypothetical protein